MSDFLHFGHYGYYIWPCLAAFGGVVIFNVVLPMRAHRRLLADLASRVGAEA